MEFQSEFAGVLHIVESEGATLPVGTVIGQILAPGETADASPGTPSAAAVGKASVTNGSHENGASATAVVAAPATRSPVAASPAASPANGQSHGRRVQASPIARRLAELMAVDLAALTGTGPNGRVVKRDVLAAAQAPPAVPGAVVAAPSEPSAAAGAAEGISAPAAAGGKGDVTVQEPSRVQATIARRMAEAKASMPEFALEVEVNMDAAVAIRAEIKALGVDDVPSYNDFVVRACALALRRHPRANSAWRDGRFELYRRVNIGVAVATPDALLVPVVHDADRCSLGEIARETRRLASAARDGALTPAELSGGTFSVSNLGMFGIGRFTAVLNPPQAAILAVGALELKAVVRDGAIVPGHRMQLTLTCDHRILYGAEAAQFLVDIRAHLEAPLRLAL
jgi:pyruvate dehydrogenase E2 component (dihydrolipoamide acetyltransferase)